MKILYLAPEIGVSYYQSGGAGTHIRGTIDELKKKNEVYCFIGGDINSTNVNREAKKVKKKSFISKIKKFVPKEIKNLKNDYSRWKNNKVLWQKLLEFINKNGKPEIIYERSGYGFDLGLRLSKHLNIPYVIESDIFVCEFHKHISSILFNRFIYKKLEKNKLTLSDKVVVMSEPSIDLLKTYWNIDSSKGFYKGLGIEIDRNRNIDFENIDYKYNLKNKFVVGFTGIFQPYHNIDLLFEVAEKIKEYDIVLLIVGKDPLGKDYATLAKEKKLNNLIFTGLIDRNEIDSYYNRFDIGFIPGCAKFMYPVKFLEYFKYEKGVIIPRYDCFKIFFDNDNDFFHYSFNENDINSMVETIIRVYMKNDKKVIDKIREFIYTNNTWEACNNRLENILYNTIPKDNKN